MLKINCRNYSLVAMFSRCRINESIIFVRIVQLILVTVLLMLPQSPSIVVAGMCLAIPVSATASSMAVDMAAYSYISDTTAEKVIFEFLIFF